MPDLLELPGKSPLALVEQVQGAERALLRGRRNRQADLGSAVAVMPYGFGTPGAAFEVAALIQTGRRDRFPVIARGGLEFWRPLGVFLRETLLSHGTISPEDAAFLFRAESADEAVDILRDRQTHGAERRITD